MTSSTALTGLALRRKQYPDELCPSTIGASPEGKALKKE